MKTETKEWIEIERIPKAPWEKPNEVIIHLLVKGEYRVTCTPRIPVGDKVATIYPSKVTCKNCIAKAVRNIKAKR